MLSVNHKPNNSQQKGERRRRLHEHQNNRGEAENKPQYRDFDGNPVK